MNKRTLRELLQDINKIIQKDPEYNSDDEELEELLRDCKKVEKNMDPDEHRWCIYVSHTCQIDDNGTMRYFSYSDVIGTGDNDYEDVGYEFEGIDEVAEVYKTQAICDVYL